MEIIKLIGVVIIVLGFALKLDVLAVVLVAGIVTGLVSGLDFFSYSGDYRYIFCKQ